MPACLRVCGRYVYVCLGVLRPDSLNPQDLDLQAVASFLGLGNSTPIFYRSSTCSSLLSYYHQPYHLCAFKIIICGTMDIKPL